MDSLNIIEKIKEDLNFLSSNGDEYRFGGALDDLMDSRYQFNVYIEGKINELQRAMINQAITYTWNLTAYQTKNFVNYFLKNYQFTFIPKTQLQVDIEGKLQTKISYFITSMGKLATEEDFDLIPISNWLQDSFVKYDLPYVLLEGNDESVKDYNKLYYIDFDGYIDPINEDDISATILYSFRHIYTGMKNLITRYKFIHNVQ